MTEEELQQTHNTFKDGFLLEFDRNTGFGSEINRQERKNHLELSITESFMKFSSSNKHFEVSNENLEYKFEMHGRNNLFRNILFKRTFWSLFNFMYHRPK